MQPVFSFIRKLFTKERVPEPGSLVEELWVAELSDERKGRFRAVQGDSYEAAYREGALELRLQRPNLFAWTEASVHLESDLVLEGEFSLDKASPYSAAGFLLRATDDENFYSVLVSSKGFFRMDVVANGGPRGLLAWTECPAPLGESLSLRVIARGERFIIMIDGLWAAEIEDETFGSGYIAFAAQNYDEGKEAATRLESCFIESRPVEVETWFYRYNYYEIAAPEARRRLAETFFSMGEWLNAAVQLRKIEKRRALDADELFLKAEASLRLELQDEAEEALDACLALKPDMENAVQEKANLLYLRARYPELRDFTARLLEKEADNARLWNLSGHARFNLGDFAGAARDYGKAAELDGNEPLYSMNEARAFDQVQDKAGAAAAYLRAAKGFYEAEADDDLALALGRLKELGASKPELEGLRAKVLYREGRHLEAGKLIDALAKSGKADASLLYLSGLVEIEKGERTTALSRFAKAVELEPSYPLYAFRYAESLFILDRPEASAAIAKALELAPGDAWTRNLAGMAALREAAALAEKGERLQPERAAQARAYLEGAAKDLPGEAEPRINLAELESLEGSADKALEVLSGLPYDGAARNEAGNALVREGRIEEAAREYEKAVAFAPGMEEYEANLASVCLELERYGDAQEHIRKALDAGGSARSYLLAGNLGLAYGERARAEAAYRVGLELSPEDPGLLMALGRCYLGGRDRKKAEACAEKLRSLDPARAEKLEGEILEATTELLSCAGCGRAWRVPRELPSQSGESIRDMPPDESPAGLCPRCGKIYCIACRKDALVENRFTCPDCGETLKLSDNRLRYLVRQYIKKVAD